MRVIKFRGWNKQSHIMVDDIQVFAPKDTVSLNSCFDDDMVVLPLQYTGLKDKNGVEIYEGDLVKISELYLDDDWSEVLEVRWASNGYHLYKQDSVGWEATLSKYEEKFNVEVIGNIYENGNLLK